MIASSHSFNLKPRLKSPPAKLCSLVSRPLQLPEGAQSPVLLHAGALEVHKETSNSKAPLRNFAPAAPELQV